MKREDPSTLLQNRIAVLEAEIIIEEQELKKSFKEVAHSLKPGNVIKNSIKEIITSPDLKSNLMNALIGLASGFITRKLIVRGSNNPVKKIIGKLAEVTVANKVSHNTAGIRSLGSMLFKKLLHKNGST